MTTETPPVETPAAAPAPPLTGTESLLSSVRVLGRPADAPPEPAQPPAPELKDPPKEPVAPEPTKEPVPAVTPAAKTPDEPTRDDPTKGLSEPAAKRFKALERHKQEAEAERDKVKLELETARKEAEAAAAQLREVETIRREAARVQEELKTYREELRAVNIERDPEFQQQYNGQIITRQQQMVDMAVAAGVPQADIIQAINTGNEETLESFREQLVPAKQRLWDANRTDIERLAYERQQAVKNSKQTWEQMEQNRKLRFEQDAERQRTENVTLARSTVENLWREIPGLDQADSAVRDEIQEWLQEAVVKAPREELVKQLAIGQLAQKIVEGQKGEIDRLTDQIATRDKELEELREKLGEQETFIKEASARTPRANNLVNSTPVEGNGSLLSAVRVHAPGR